MQWCPKILDFSSVFALVCTGLVLWRVGWFGLFGLGVCCFLCSFCHSFCLFVSFLFLLWCVLGFSCKFYQLWNTSWAPDVWNPTPAKPREDSLITSSVWKMTKKKEESLSYYCRCWLRELLRFRESRKRNVFLHGELSTALWLELGLRQLIFCSSTLAIWMRQAVTEIIHATKVLFHILQIFVILPNVCQLH